MSTVAIYNGFGKYEVNGKGQKGITLTYGGVPFFLAFKKVTYIPDFTFREVDHNATTASEGEEGHLAYKSFRVSGQRIAEELLETQIPVPNKDKGIIVIDSKKGQTGTFLNVPAGITEEGIELTAEVAEINVSDVDAARAEKTAYDYKKQVIEEYFQGKRERMAGGVGHRTTPIGFTKLFMEELGVKDLDTLPTQGNSELEQLLTKVLGGVAANQAPQAKPKDAKSLV